MTYSCRGAYAGRTDTKDDNDDINGINGIMCRPWGDSIAGGGG